MQLVYIYTHARTHGYIYSIGKTTLLLTMNYQMYNRFYLYNITYKQDVINDFIGVRKVINVDLYAIWI